MNINYEIIDFLPNTGSIVVRWYCDELPDGLIYNVDLPILYGQYPEFDQLDSIIKRFEPTGQIERIVQLKNTPVPEYLHKLVRKPFEKVNT